MLTQTVPRQQENWPAKLLSDPDWAWEPFQPDRRRPWNLPWAGHLLRRATFGANWGRLKQALDDGPQRTVDRLLESGDELADFSRSLDRFESASVDSIDSLSAWWLRRMLETPQPLLEKMTLFWHGFFAVSNSRVESPKLMLQYVRLLRRHALGDYGAMLEGVVGDPAVLTGLGGSANRKMKPNIDFARRLIEHFLLGPGTCTEKDIDGIARAMTGCFVLGKRFRFKEREHDLGEKEILGQRGAFDAQDVVRIVLTQPAASRLVVRRLYRWLISETAEPDRRLIGPLVESFGKDHDVSALVGRMLRSNLFYSPVAYRQRIKCPAEFALGLVGGLAGTVATTHLDKHMAALGQSLYEPPTVDGWRGGRYWTNKIALIDRGNLALALLAGLKPYEKKLDPAAVANKHGHATPEAAGRFVVDLFLQADLPENVYQRLLRDVSDPAGTSSPADRLRRLAHCVAALPEFHLA